MWTGQSLNGIVKKWESYAYLKVVIFSSSVNAATGRNSKYTTVSVYIKSRLECIISDQIDNKLLIKVGTLEVMVNWLH